MAACADYQIHAKEPAKLREITNHTRIGPGTATSAGWISVIVFVAQRAKRVSY